eukprot:sb/3464782/
MSDFDMKFGRGRIQLREPRNAAAAFLQIEQPPVQVSTIESNSLNPSVGLDTFMSEQLVGSLKHLTLKGRSILLTIHQPSAETFGLFDKVILLKDGYTVYQGEPGLALPDFVEAGAVRPSDKYINPADYLLLSLSTEGDELLERISRHSRHLMYERRCRGGEVPDGQQLSTLCWRESLSLFRNKPRILTKCSEVGIVSLIFGFLYWQLPDDFSAVQTKLGLIFILLFYWNYSTYIGALQIELSDRERYRREVQSNAYSTSAYLLSTTLVRLGLDTLYTLVFYSVPYWMAGLDGGVTNFLIFIFVAWLSSRAAVSYGYLISSISPSMKVAFAGHIPLLLPLFLTAGLFINVDTIPWYLKWCQYISFYYYSFEAMCVTQFYSEEPYPLCNGMSCPLNSGEDVLESLSFQESSVWIKDIPMLFVLLVAYRLLALLFIKKGTQ